MGWGRMLLLGNWGQQMDIEDQRQEIEDLKQQMRYTAVQASDNLQARVAQLENDNRELRLYLAALIRYLGHRGMMEQDEFRQLVEVIDAEDGRADGGYRGKMIK